MASVLRVVIAGAGIAGLETLLTLSDLAAASVDPTLIEPQPELALHALGTTEPFGAASVGRVPGAELR